MARKKKAIQNSERIVVTVQDSTTRIALNIDHVHQSSRPTQHMGDLINAADEQTSLLLAEAEKILQKFAEKDKSNIDQIKSSLVRKKTEERLSTILFHYKADKLLEPLVPREAAAITAAADQLSAILRSMDSLPATLIARFYRSRRLSPDAFNAVRQEIELMKAFLEKSKPKRAPGRKSDRLVANAAHRLADLYASLVGKKFSKTTATVPLTGTPVAFKYNGAEFVRQMMHKIDPDITLSEVKTALVAYPSRQKKDRN